MSVMYIVYCQKWEESERGWGVRPDGYSLHVDRDEVTAFISRQNAKMPDAVPDEYSRPSGSPYACEVSKEMHDRVQKEKSVVSYKNDYPQRV